MTDQVPAGTRIRFTGNVIDGFTDEAVAYSGDTGAISEHQLSGCAIYLVTIDKTGCRVWLSLDEFEVIEDE